MTTDHLTHRIIAALAVLRVHCLDELDQRIHSGNDEHYHELQEDVTEATILLRTYADLNSIPLRLLDIDEARIQRDAWTFGQWLTKFAHVLLVVAGAISLINHFSAMLGWS